MEVERRRTRWALTPPAFDRLLERLSSDRAQAGVEFEQLRRYLITLLTYAGAADPEHLADVTLDRAAKRLSEGETIDNLRAWLRGAARNVFSEARLEMNRESVAAKAPAAGPSANIEEDIRMLGECLERLPPESRSLIEQYYQAAGEPLLAARRRLAEQLGISREALCTRALRLRKILERCFEERREKRREA